MAGLGRSAIPQATVSAEPRAACCGLHRGNRLGSNRTLADLLGEPQAFHAYAPVWQPLFWNLADQSPDALLASDNSWLQMMAVLRVEDAAAATFRDIFTQAVHRVKKIKAAEHVRWQALM